MGGIEQAWVSTILSKSVTGKVVSNSLKMALFDRCPSNEAPSIVSPLQRSVPSREPMAKFVVVDDPHRFPGILSLAHACVEGWRRSRTVLLSNVGVQIDGCNSQPFRLRQVDRDCSAKVWQEIHDPGAALVFVCGLPFAHLIESCGRGEMSYGSYSEGKAFWHLGLSRHGKITKENLRVREAVHGATRFCRLNFLEASGEAGGLFLTSL